MFIKSTVLCGVACAALVPGLAHAQATATPADQAGATGDGGEIIVTAQRRAEALQDVPIAVTVIQSDKLASSNINQLTELSKMTPSLYVPEGGSQTVPYIRGVGSAAITPGNESTAAVYVDGVYQFDKTGIMLQSFPEVASLQVLRGPQGTLFGRNATSGAILISTRQPGREPGMMLEGTYGTADRRARGYVETPITSNLSGSLSGFYNYQTGYITVRNAATAARIGGRTGDEQSYGVRAKLRYDGDPFTAELSGNYIQGYTTAIFAEQPVAGSPTSIGEAVALGIGVNIRAPRDSYYGEIRPITTYKTYGSSLKMSYDFGSFSLQSTSAYTKSSSGVQLDLDQSPVPIFYFTTDLQGRAYQQEFLLSSDKSSRLQWVGGAYYIDYRDGYAALDQNVGLSVPLQNVHNQIPAQLLALSAAGAGPASGAAYIAQSNFVTIKSLGIFADATYPITDALKITAGVRYTTERDALDPSGGKTTYLPNGAGGVIAIPDTYPIECAANPACRDLKSSFKRVTYRAVIDYKFNPDAMMYVSYNRGFKSGVYNISSIPNVIPTKPEILDALEVGLKTKPMRNLTFNLTGYYYKYRDLQVVVVDPNTNTQKSINAAKATISGLEAELSYTPAVGLSLTASLSKFLKSKYDSFPNCEIYRPQAVGIGLVSNGNCTGQDMPVTPDIMASLAASYKLELPNESSITMNGLLSYIDKMDLYPHGFYPAGVDAAGVPYPAGEGRAPIQQSITTLNLSVTFRPPGDTFYVSIWGNDLLDQSTRLFRNLQTTSFGYMTAYGRGTTAGVTVGMKFGGAR